MKFSRLRNISSAQNGEKYMILKYGLQFGPGTHHLLKKLDAMSEIQEKLGRALALTCNTHIGHPVPHHPSQSPSITKDLPMPSHVSRQGDMNESQTEANAAVVILCEGKKIGIINITELHYF